MKHQSVLLLLVHFLAIVGRAAVIPLPPNSNDLQSETGEFFNEDAYHLENPTTTDDEDHAHQIIVDDNEDNNELQHTHGDDEQDVILEDVDYILDTDGHNFVVAEKPAEGETLHDPGLHITEDQSTPSSPDEDGEDEEYIFEDDEESLNQELVIDPETGMPLFKNKDDNDFDTLVSKWVTDEVVDSVDFYDDDQEQVESGPQSRFPFAFFPNNWRLLMAVAGLALVIKLLRIGKNKHANIKNGNGNNNGSMSSATTHLFSKKQSKYDHSVIRILPVHGQQARKSSSREYPHLVLPPTEDNLAAAAAARTNHRASLGHIRRLSAGNNNSLPMHHSPAMTQHARHTSFSGKYPAV